LIMQVTSAGAPSGILNAQVFENGNGATDIRLTYEFDGAGTYYEEGAGGGGNDVLGCTDATACNFDADATQDDGSCVLADGDCESCDGNGGVLVSDADGDGVCDGDEISGCQDATACNYDASATDSDDSCVFADGNCEVCDGNGGVAVEDADGDGVCDGDEIAGCQDATACNYDASATDSDDSCVFADDNCEVCDGNGGVAAQDADGDGVCDGDEIAGCQDATACNYDASATDADDSCVFADGNCEVCDGNGGVAVQDADGDGVCDGDEIAGCQDAMACNYDASATDADDSCVFADGNCEVCDGNGGVAVQDADADGVCDGDEIAGCQDDTACNYDASATDSDDSCVFADGNCEVCDGNGGVAVQDADGDGVCDGEEIAGCQDDTACNYDASATDSDDSCVFADGNCEVCDGNGGVAVQDADGDGVCDSDETEGCTTEGACNYNASATEDDGSCVFASETCEECAGGEVVLQDADGDGVCDGDEIAGCQDDAACNYDASATDAGDCVFADGNCEVCDGNGGVIVQDSDGDGVCDSDETEGCTDPEACNYNPGVTDNDGSCVYADDACEVCNANGGVTLNDADGDGVCDADEIVGCQDAIACNYDASATDAGDCVFAVGPCDSCDGNGGVETADEDGDGICDADEIAGCQNADACNYNADATDADDSCVFADNACEFCDGNGGVALNDADADGICDDVDECIGAYDDCGVCNGPGAVYDCGCNDIPEGDCDCDGNVLNECGECAAEATDTDGDGIADCNEIPGCTDSASSNYNPDATDDDGSCLVGGCLVSFACNFDPTADFMIFSDCEFDSCSGCTDEEACNYDPAFTQEDGSCEYAEAFLDCDGNCLNDTDGDGTCDELEVFGCTDATNPGYNANATEDDGSCQVGGCTIDSACNFDASADYLIADSCDFDSCAGCTDSEACNYDATATNDDGSCAYPAFPYLDCEGNCLNDEDGDGVCNELEIGGCTDPNSIAFNPVATDDDGSCLYLGCTVASACNYDVAANFNDGSCDFQSCVGCGNPAACNYDEAVIYSVNFLCDFAEEGLDCDGNCINDADADGICDNDEIVGCQDSSACNYNANATDEGTCDFSCFGCTAQGACNFNPLATQNDGSCDFESCTGCTDEDACNYDPNATINVSGLCEFVSNALLDCDGNCVDDADEDGICDANEVPGCTNPDAVNYNPYATDDNGSCLVGECTLPFACNYTPFVPGQNYLDVTTCVFPPCDLGLTEDPGAPALGAMPMTGCDIPSACNYGDPVNPCDFLSCLSLGCTDEAACNFDDEAVFDDGTCDYFSCAVPGCMNASACNYNPEATTGDGSCEFTSCVGCTDELASNFDPEATFDNGSCTYPGCIFPSACNFDPAANVNDGSCEYSSCIGCADAVACNYDETVTIVDNSSCEYAEAGYDCEGICLADADEDGVCDGNEIAGCTDEAADNYNAAATDDNGSCLYPVPGCLQPNACNYNPEATISDGSCEFSSCVGCTDLSACNYDENAIYSDQTSCTFPAEDYLDCAGNCINDADGDGICDELDACFDLTACNYDDAANVACEVLDACGVCGGDGVDTDGDGVCDAEEIFGCTEPTACNYAANATEEDGSCDFCSCAQTSASFDGYTIETEIVEIHEQGDLAGMTTYRFFLVTPNNNDVVTSFTGNDEFALSLSTTTSWYQHPGGGYSPEGLMPAFLAVYPDLAYDSYVTLNLDGPAGSGEDDIVALPGAWKTQFEAGNSFVVNDIAGSGWYVTPDVSNAQVDENNRMFFAQLTTDGEVSGSFRAQVFLGGDSDVEERVDVSFNQPVCGCTDPMACNYNENAAHDAGNCLYLVDGYDCFGTCLADADGDGVCDEFEVEGCMDDLACNYDSSATDDFGCTYTATEYVDCEGSCLSDADGDGVCDEEEVVGCADEDACNYDASATDADDSCTYPANPFVDCDGNCLQDADGDGVCNQFEILGCNDAAACNFNALATEFDGSCILPQGCETCSGETDGTGVVVDNDADDDGVCDTDEIVGCQEAMACNYDVTATDPGFCLYPDAAACEVCDGNGGIEVQDADGDGVSDCDEVEGCQDEFACNFLPTATEAGECDYCSCQGNTTSIDGYGVVVEELMVHGEGDLAGQTTYAVYLTTPNAEDVVTSFTGNDAFALSLATTTSFFQVDGQGVTPENLSASMIAMLPNSAYDSYVTIGLTGPAGDGEANIGLAPGTWDNDFEAGNSFVVNDAVGSGWYTLPSATNAVAGPDHRVLMAQLTTDGKISGSFTAQVFPMGDNVNDERVDISFLDGVCGCTESGAANYDDNADFDDGSCFYIPAGCTDVAACNFVAGATEDDGSCIYADGACEACNGDGGVDVLDADGDGVCDADEVVGCQDAEACNYDATATDAGSCVFADGNCEICNEEGGVTLQDADGDGVCDGDEVVGCQDAEACNYDMSATDAGPCVYADGNCEVCDGNGGVAVQDADGDGVCDGDEVIGCQDATACNYDADATDAGACVYVDGICEICDGNGGVLTQDADGDGVCDGDEIVGCQDDMACNYDAAATDAGSCVFADGNCEVCDGNGGVIVQDADGDGVCDGDEVVGCQDDMACNYDATATDAGSCLYADAGACEVCDGNGGAVVQDTDGDGVSDCDEIVGCQDDMACNYDATATDAGNCVYADGDACEVCDGNGGIEVLDADGDGVCDADEVVGCQDAEACNYDAAATDAGACVYPDAESCEICDGNGGVEVQDADGDGVTDCDEVVGCQDDLACDYNADATDAGECDYGCYGCTYAAAANYDAGATFDDGSCLFEGCTNDDYQNFNPYANEAGGLVCTDMPISGDFNGDGVVQNQDLLDFLLAYGQSGPEWGGVDWIADACEVVGEAFEDIYTPVDHCAGEDAPVYCAEMGCTYPTAQNYNADATIDGGDCVWMGCTDSAAYNYNAIANLDDSSCNYNICPDFNGDGQVQAQDLLNFLLAWGQEYDN